MQTLFDLPEKEPETLAAQSSSPAARPIGWRYVVPGIALLCASAVGAMTYWAPQTAAFLRDRGALDLSTKQTGGIITVEWNHRFPEVDRCSSAKLTIQDGDVRREVTLTKQNLRMGHIAYQRRSPHVAFTIELDLPDAEPLVQSVDAASNPG